MIIIAVVALVASGSIKINLRSLARCILVSNIVVIPAYIIDRLLALVPPTRRESILPSATLRLPDRPSIFW